MIVLALVLLIIVLVFCLAIVVSNPDVYQLSLFRVLVPVTSAGVFFTGFGAALVTITALLLLRAGIRRSRETRRRLRSAGQPETSSIAGPGDNRTDGARDDEPRSTEPAGNPTPSILDLDSGDDRTAAAVDRRAAGAGTETRDEPRA